MDDLFTTHLDNLVDSAKDVQFVEAANLSIPKNLQTLKDLIDFQGFGFLTHIGIQMGVTQLVEAFVGIGGHLMRHHHLHGMARSLDKPMFEIRKFFTSIATRSKGIDEEKKFDVFVGAIREIEIHQPTTKRERDNIFDITWLNEDEKYLILRGERVCGDPSWENVEKPEVAKMEWLNDYHKRRFDAFLLGTHERVGINSNIGLLCDDVLGMILDNLMEAPLDVIKKE